MKALEGKYLYQEVELTENLHSGLSVGRKGAVLEIIDRDTVFAEFYDEKGNQVEWNGETVFEVGIHQLKLKSNKMYQHSCTHPKNEEAGPQANLLMPKL